MANKINTIASAEAQAAWAKAKTADEKKAAVNEFEDLRHLYSEAWEIWNNLPDAPASETSTQS